MMNGYTYIDTNDSLKQITSLFGTEKIIGVDLEADSMFHFHEKVCLIQMASLTATVVIDPLPITDMTPFKEILEAPGIRKIFHGSDYDVRSIYRDFNIEIHNLFDTELASRFLGETESGLGAVLHNRFGLNVDKSFQKKNWSMRPLPQAMISYAAGDVKYLVKLAAMIDQELAEKKRTAWVLEECRLLSQVRAPEPNGEPLFVKCKGAGRLDGKSLYVLELLLQKRRELAEKKDVPPFKVIGNRQLLDMAKFKPTSLQEMKNIRSLSTKNVHQHGDVFLEAINKVNGSAPSAYPVYPRIKRRRVGAAIPGRIQEIKNWRDKKALAYALPASLLLNKHQLKSIAIANPRKTEDFDGVKDLREWQKKEFGQAIIDVLNRSEN